MMIQTGYSEQQQMVQEPHNPPVEPTSSYLLWGTGVAVPLAVALIGAYVTLRRKK